MGRRVLAVLVIAALKRTRSTTHVMRKTGMTIYDHDQTIPEAEMQVMSGHQRKNKLLARYISARWKFPTKWSAIMPLPTPDQVRERAAEIASEPDFAFPTPDQVRAMKAKLELR